MAWHHFEGKQNIDSPRRWSKTYFAQNDSRVLLVFGKSSPTSGQTQSLASRLPRCFGLPMEALHCAICSDVLEPISWGVIDASIQWWKGKPAPRAIALRAPWCKLQISVGTAGPQPRADLSGHRRTSTLLAPDVSGHCRTSTAVSMSERMADRMSE